MRLRTIIEFCFIILLCRVPVAASAITSTGPGTITFHDGSMLDFESFRTVDAYQPHLIVQFQNSKRELPFSAIQSLEIKAYSCENKPESKLTKLMVDIVTRTGVKFTSPVTGLYPSAVFIRDILTNAVQEQVVFFNKAEVISGDCLNIRKIVFK